MKYPRTYHLPYSPGSTSDDKKLQDGWFEYYRGKEVVFTEKLDGENTAMNQYDVFARSHSAPTRSPWSKNLWDPSDGLYWKVKPYIGVNETVYGENLYGVHSIEYDCLNAFWYMFAANDGNVWYSWDDVVSFSNITDVPHVPELYRDVVRNENDVREIIEELMNHTSYLGWNQKEGIVMRLADSFPITEFQHYVCKYVRKDHVYTDVHWTKTWKKAELNKMVNEFRDKGRNMYIEK